MVKVYFPKFVTTTGVIMVLPTWTAPKSVLDTEIGFCVAAAQVIAKSDKDRTIQYARLRRVPRQLMLFALFTRAH
jgi:glycine cleavage system protein P-like pyridoxal-binding family